MNKIQSLIFSMLLCFVISADCDATSPSNCFTVCTNDMNTAVSNGTCSGSCVTDMSTLLLEITTNS